MQGIRGAPWRLQIFSTPAVPLAVLAVPLITYLPTFYATEIGVKLTAVGVVFMFGRACDGAFDLLVGMMSDSTRGRFGRRKPWMLAGLVPLMVSTWMLCQPSPGVGAGYLCVMLILFYVAWTVVQIPYLSWGAELAHSYDDRTVVFGFQQGGTLIGIILGTGLPALLLPSASSIRSTLSVISITAIILLPTTVIATLLFLPERPASECGRIPINFVELRKIIRSNRPYIAFLIQWLAAYTAINIYSATMVLLITERLDLPGAFMSLVFWQYLSAIALLPLTLRAAHAIGRHKMLVLGLATIVAVLLLLMIVPARHYAIAAAVFALLGLPSAAVWALPPAMIADLADFGRLQGGTESTGTYMAGYNLVLKGGMALGVGIAFPLLASLGFDTTRLPPAQGGWSLLIVCCAIPAAMLIPCACLIWRYPIDAHRQELIQIRLRRRELYSRGGFRA